MKKRIISLLLAVIMIVGMLPLSAITAFAEEPVTDTAVPFLNWSETEKNLYEDSVTDIKLTAGEAGESTTITPQTLTKKADKFTVTVEGENYSYFHIEDFTTHQSDYLDSGDSREVTAGGEYRIEATCDELYVAENLGDWAVDPDSGKLFIELTAGKAGESTTVTAPKLIKKVAITLFEDGNYSSVKVTATDSNGTHVISKDNQHLVYRVKLGDTVNISASFNTAYYRIGALTEGWDINGGEVERSFVVEDVSESLYIFLPSLYATDKYTVTIVGDNYSSFIFCGQLCDFGASCTRSVGTGFDIVAFYDTNNYKPEDLGNWILDPDGSLRYISVGGAAGEKITVTAPTLISIKYTVTVNGENYSHFLAEDLTEEDYLYFDPGEACKLTPNDDYKIYAYYDSAYEPKDLGDWAIDTESGELYIELTAGEEGTSTTITAPDLVRREYNEQQDNEPTGLGSVLSDGNIWIILVVAVIALGGVAALVIVKKKKKPALASGTDNTDEE